MTKKTGMSVNTMLVILGTALAMLSSGPASAQVKTPGPPPVAGARPVTIERITVHSPAIAGNLEGL
ncbi:hypothetical protein HMP09_3122 [Sphingomonas sp. HMP9]|uniref:hypothetical protein n=1 Tax=Sphingomonas sp. HMP9 TaxID=1517554 RepID=UPI001596869B|nr:hypothetical protein [Sphingomonas sp. HMP9]BCA63888.1 hypothetical protein HMP09_3122 [Sphingomonas sp. HMP9]